MKTAVVLGASGHLGQALVHELLSSGYSVVAGVRRVEAAQALENAYSHENGRFCARIFDILDILSVRRCIAGADAVFHTAAPNAPERILRAEVRDKIITPTIVGSVNVVNAMREEKVHHLIYSSSCSTLGIRNESPSGIDETSRIAKLHHPITQSKWLAELEISRLCADDERVKLSMFHIPWMIGPGFSQPTSSTNPFVHWALGRRFHLPDIGVHFVDARDVARAQRLGWEAHTEPGARRWIVGGEYLCTLALLQKMKVCRPLLKTDAHPTPWLAVAALALAKSSLARLRNQVPDFGIAAFLDLYRCDQQLNTTRVKKELAASFRTADESLADMMTWIEKQLETGRFSARK